MKIKKYTIDQEIPKGSKFLFKEGGDIISTTTGGRYLYNEQYFYFLVEEEKTAPTCKGCDGAGGCGGGGGYPLNADCVRCQIEHVEPGEKILARASFNLPNHTCGLQIENLEEDY